MREPDVRLSDDERAAFESCVRLLREPTPTARSRRLWRWVTLHRARTCGTVCAVVGVASLVGGVVTANPAWGTAGFAAAVWGLSRMTRRVTWAWIVLRWRRCTAPAGAEHMWEP